MGHAVGYGESAEVYLYSSASKRRSLFLEVAVGRPDAVEAVPPSNTAEDRLRIIVDSTPALVHTAKPDGYLDYFNQRWLEYEFGES